MRRPIGNPPFDRVEATGPALAQFGVTRATPVDSHQSYLNFTPYVGPRQGVCRQSHGAKLAVTGMRNGVAFGTSRFDGLASFSVRCA